MRTLLLPLFFLISLCSVAQTLHLENDPSRFVDNLNVLVPDKAFGGISGIEYVQAKNKWYFITDGTGPGRPSYLFEFEGSTTDSYPQWQQSNPIHAALVKGLSQSEAIRFDGKQLWICTEEGVEPGAAGATDIFEKGSIAVASQNGESWSVQRPAFQYASKLNNRGHEAMAIAGNDTICTISEWPLIGDSGYARLKVMTCPNGTCKTIAEYAYELDMNSCVTDGTNTDGSIGNGISEMLYVGNGRYLMMERCFNGKTATVKLYETNLNDAPTNISSVDFKDLGKAGPFRPLPKQEVFNFSSIKDLKIDNLEGMTWGPDRKSIAVVSDNNFEANTARQKTQWIVLKVVK